MHIHDNAQSNSNSFVSNKFSLSQRRRGPMALSNFYTDIFVPDVFNRLSDIDDDDELRVRFTEASTPILKLMAEKSMTDHIGLWYPHKHFDVKDGEYIGSYVPDDKPIELVMQTSVLSDRKEFVPACLYMHEGKWMPMQFVSNKVPGAQESYDFFLQNAANFLPEITNMMKELGLKGKMGIVLRNDTSLDKKDGMMLDEQTDRVERFQQFTWKKADDYEKTVFITYWCVDIGADPLDFDDRIEACFEVVGADNIVKVGCQRAHQCCPPFDC